MVHFYQSTMAGAPALSGTAGAFIGVLDAVLVNGFGAVTLTSLTVTSGIATATCDSGHGFSMLGGSGPLVGISGSTPNELNGIKRVTVTNSTVFTFAAPGVDDGTASGTILANRPGLGWGKVFSGTNVACYRCQDVTSTRLFLRADDTATQYTAVTMYENMTDVNTGTGPSSTFYVYKSSAANTTARDWNFFADDLLFYFFAKSDGTSWLGNMQFGDVVSFAPNDAYACIISANSAASSSTGTFSAINNTQDWNIARSYTQNGGAVGLGRYSSVPGTSIGSGGMSAYPNPVNGECVAGALFGWESDMLRCVIPGVFNPAHQGSPAHGTFVDNFQSPVAGETCTVFLQYYISAVNKRCALFNISSAWR